MVSARESLAKYYKKKNENVPKRLTNKWAITRGHESLDAFFDTVATQMKEDKNRENAEKKLAEKQAKYEAKVERADKLRVLIDNSRNNTDNKARTVAFVIYTAVQTKNDVGVYATRMASTSIAWNPVSIFKKGRIFVLDDVDWIKPNALAKAKHGTMLDNLQKSRYMIFSNGFKDLIKE